MKISRELKLENIQQQFQSVFPHLKIEFYSRPHKTGEGSEVKTQISNLKKVGQICDLDEVEIPLNGEMTVKEFESIMEENFGLHVQVFRKSANLWLQTAATDGWTLDKQEGKGGRSEKFAEK
ncbi:MAG: hypothetical protein HKN68_19165 [Saprospiraceae bacterium]|nr:hypothetical protein [Saprospiraceae bacterium]